MKQSEFITNLKTWCEENKINFYQENIYTFTTSEEYYDTAYVLTTAVLKSIKEICKENEDENASISYTIGNNKTSSGPAAMIAKINILRSDQTDRMFTNWELAYWMYMDHDKTILIPLELVNNDVADVLNNKNYFSGQLISNQGGSYSLSLWDMISNFEEEFRTDDF